MAAVISFFLILIISILVTKIATVALVHTGLSRESARFQARSAFSGVGFTTTEAERLVNHPVRRKILMMLMLLGNAGIVTAMTSLVLSFVNTKMGSAVWFWRLGIIVGGAGTLWFLARSTIFDRGIGILVGWALKRFTRLDTRDYVSLLHLSGEYSVKEMEVEKDDWLEGRSLEDLQLSREGVLVLGIQRSRGIFIGAPTKKTQIKKGDILILYGRERALQKLDERRSGHVGDREHLDAVSEQDAVVRAQEKEEAPPAGKE